MAEHRDPVTGDALTTGEWVSWIVQGIIRRWLFLVIISLCTLLIWIINVPTLLLWWNLCASYLALLIESIVGIAMFSQTRRDAVVLREIRRMDQRIEQMDERILTTLLQMDQANDRRLENAWSPPPTTGPSED